MQLSFENCCAEAARHRAIADFAVLPNVRLIANRAADAWATEALLAKKREDRARRMVEDAEVSKDTAQSHHRLLSENPDRGCADD